MHQVLSYETAVRANNVSEYREYVTKRTCISLVVTIAFFTLISACFPHTADRNRIELDDYVFTHANNLLQVHITNQHIDRDSKGYYYLLDCLHRKVQPHFQYVAKENGLKENSLALLSYLLGNFVSERKNHIRMLLTKKAITTPTDDKSSQTIDITSTDYMNLQELHAYQKTKTKLLASAQSVTKLLQRDESYRSTSLNTEIFNKYISCTQDVPPNTNIETSQFIEQLVDNTSARQRDCMRIIQAVIENNLITN